MKIIDMRLGNNMQGLLDMVAFIQKFYDTKELTLLEIGSFKGESSEIFAKNFKRVTCVDPWNGASVEMYMNTCTPADYEKAFDERMAKYDNVKKVKATSLEASKKITGNFDVVYIDGAHDYGNVKLDITTWQDRAQLIICGHDYSPKHKGVMKAVNEIYYLPDEQFKDHSWFVWKNRDSQALKYKYNDNYVLNRIEGKKEFAVGKIHARKQAIANYFNVKGKTILDVGFGRGELLKICASKGAKCIGIDYSAAAYQIANKYLTNNKVKLINDSITNIDKYDFEYSIDIMFMIDIIEHISLKEFQEFMEKIKDKLSSDCQIFVHTPKNIHAGDIYNMHITQWSKEMLSVRFGMFKDIEIKENPGNYYLIAKGLK